MIVLKCFWYVKVTPNEVQMKSFPKTLKEDVVKVNENGIESGEFLTMTPLTPLKHLNLHLILGIFRLMMFKQTKICIVIVSYSF